MRQCPTRILACGRVSGFLHTIFLLAHNVHVTTQPPPGYSALRRWPFRPPPDEKESGSFHGSWQPVRDLPVVEPHFPGCSAHLPYHVYHSAIAESSGSPPKKRCLFVLTLMFRYCFQGNLCSPHHLPFVQLLAEA